MESLLEILFFFFSFLGIFVGIAGLCFIFGTLFLQVVIPELIDLYRRKRRMRWVNHDL